MLGYYKFMIIVTAICFAISVILLIISRRLRRPPKDYNIKARGRVIYIHRINDKYKPVFRYYYYYDMMETAVLKTAVSECEVKLGQVVDIYLKYNNRGLCWYCRNSQSQALKSHSIVLMLIVLCLDIIGIAMIEVFN